MIHTSRFAAAAVLLLACSASPSVPTVSEREVANEDRAPRALEDVLARGERVQALYRDHRSGDLGILDVTRPPYAADPSGKADATAAIQRAVRDARDARMICFFPTGTYRVSDTIVAAQRHVYGRGAPLRRDDFPCILWGSTRGGRATIILADNSPFFSDPKNPRPVLFVASYNDESKLQPNISFNQMIVSLDVELGNGNPGAIGIDHQGAQGCVTEDVNVVAEGAFAGFRGTSGSGGSASHIRVRGGRYGLYLRGLGLMRRFAGSQPCPVISRLTLSGQTEKSILCATRGPLTLVGATIDGPGIDLAGAWREWNGALNIVDSIIRHRGEGPAITGDRPVYLNNVYFEHAPVIVRLENTAALQGSRDGWTRVVECAAGPSPLHPVWMNEAKLQKPVIAVQRGSRPPTDLVRPHEWTQPLPSWEDKDVANVKEAPYAAKGDGESDDTDAIQGALNASRNVFLPKGKYRIARSLQLRSDSRLFGLGIYSVIEPLGGALAFSNSTEANPMLTAPNDPDATCMAAFLQLTYTAPGAYPIHWQAGRRSIVRNVRMRRWPRPRNAPPAHHPVVLIDGNGGGRWYNTLTHYKFPQDSDHRHILVCGTRQPLAFYMLNPEHSNANYMVEFDDVRNVNVYGIKSETLGARGPRALTPVWIRRSSAFRFFGHGGNACPPEGQPLYRIENCTDFLLANFTYQRYKEGANPSTWYMVEERLPSGKVIRTPATEHFVAYKHE